MLSLFLLVLCVERILGISVSLDISPRETVVPYGDDSEKITCSLRLVSSPYSLSDETLARERTIFREGNITTFSFEPEEIIIVLSHYDLSIVITMKQIPLGELKRNNQTVEFYVGSVQQSGRYMCQIRAVGMSIQSEVSSVYVKLEDHCIPVANVSTKICGSSPNSYTATKCLDEDCVCVQKYGTASSNSRHCTIVELEDGCRPKSACDGCECLSTPKFIVGKSYQTVNTSTQEMANFVAISGDILYNPGTIRNCYSCKESSSPRILTALLVTFLVLVSCAVTVVGAAVLYDWWNRRADLQELAREHTDTNMSAVEVDALRRVIEDRPPSYLDSRKSDLHLVGLPPPTYEDVCCPTPPVNIPHSLSTPRLNSNPANSVISLETIDERRFSM